MYPNPGKFPSSLEFPKTCIPTQIPIIGTLLFKTSESNAFLKPDFSSNNIVSSKAPTPGRNNFSAPTISDGNFAILNGIFNLL